MSRIRPTGEPLRRDGQRVVKEDKVAAQVEVRAGPHRVVSLMTREAADELGLEPGTVAVAAVKATSVVIEVSK